MYPGKTFDELRIGEKFSKAVTVTDAHMVAFAGISGDFHPMHLDEEYAKKSVFKGRVVYGQLIMSFVSGVLATLLWDTGMGYVGQSWRFLDRVMIGDTITAEVEAVEKTAKNGKGVVNFKARCFNQNGDTVVEGEVIVMVSNRHHPYHDHDEQP